MKINKNILMLAGLGAVTALVIWYGMTYSGPEPLLTTTDVTGASGAAERELIDTLLELRSITLDGSIFFDDAFLSLRDFGSQIVSEPVGRVNPFAPLEVSQKAPTGAQ